MTNAEKGILMLMSPLGSGRDMPLSCSQFHSLRKVMEHTRPGENGEVTESALRAMGIGSRLAAQIVSLLDREKLLDAYLTAGWRKGIGTLTRLDKHFPRILERKLGMNAPPVLFCKGDPALLQNPCVGLVGSRKILAQNRAFAERIGLLAAKEGYTLVSGGAYGADSAAQNACLKNDGKVIVFTPERLDRIQERENVLYCSEGGWDLEFTAQRALSRNRLIHAMGDKTFVAQCDAGRGGSWRGAEENLRHGYSRVFVFWDGSDGAVSLLEKGAIETLEPASIRELNPGQRSFFEP